MFLTVLNDKILSTHNGWDNRNNVSQLEVNEDSSCSNTTCSNGNIFEQQQVAHPEFNYPCPKCTKGFKRGDHLKRHLLSVHDQDLPYHCGDCPKAFVSAICLSKHCETSHFGVSKKGPFCGWCGNKFWCVQDLEKHANLMHQKQDTDYMMFVNKICKVYGCPYCQKTVSNQKILQRHIEKVHSIQSGKSHVCLKCFCTFKTVSQLESHYKDCRCNNVLKSEQQLMTDSNNSSPSANIKSYQYNSLNQLPHFGIEQRNNHIIKDNKNLHGSFPNNIRSSQSLPNNTLQNPLFCALSPEYNCNNTSNKNRRETASVWQKNHQISNSVNDQQVTNNPSVLVSKISRNEPNTVSEALSLAMKALSEFSYEDLFCHYDDYVPAGFSVFQSTSPLPNFHYPNTVHLSDLFEDESIDRCNFSSNSCVLPNINNSNELETMLSNSYNSHMPSLSNSTQIHQSSMPTSKIAASEEAILHSQNANGTIQSCGNAFKMNNGYVDDLNPLQAKRGRPKKKKTYGSEFNKYVSQSMILKIGDDIENSKFTCTVCNESFEGVDCVMRHLEAIHLASNTQECCLCKKRFAQAGNVKRHIRFVHLRERPFQCNDCDSTFDRLCYLQRHMRSHVNNHEIGGHLFPSECPECGKQCLTRDHLRGHMLRKHLAKNKGTSKELMKKYKYILGANDKAAADHAQNKETNSRVEPTKSNEVIETVDRPSERVCKDVHKFRRNNHFKLSKTNSATRISWRRALNNLKATKVSVFLPFKCRRCFGRRFPKLSLLKSHVAYVHHRNLGRYFCHYCGITCSDKAMLLSHLKKRHTR